jgi:hypothetical protein
VTHDVPDNHNSPLYGEYARLILRADDAARALHAAQVANDLEARERAEFDRENAIGDLWAFKERVAADLFLMIRLAADVQPERLRERLGLGDVEAAVLELAGEVATLRSSRRAA